MFEELGPTMARAIVGEDYNPNFKYELETCDEGLRIHITDKRTGECHTMQLEDTYKESKHYDPLYDDERVDDLRKVRQRSTYGMMLACTVAAITLGLLMLTAVFIKGAIT